MATLVPLSGTAHTETLDPSTSSGQAFAARFPGSVIADSRPNYTGWIVNKDKLVEVASALRDEFGFDFLSSVTGVDYFPNTMEVVYESFKTTGGPSIRFKVQVPRVDPIEVPSLTSVWPGARSGPVAVARITAHPRCGIARPLATWTATPCWPA